MLGGIGWRGLSRGACGWWEFRVYKVQLINVVNENETKWTYFRLIIHPVQVKRSGV